MSITHPRQAIEAFWAKEISGLQLQRIFANYDEWLVPAKFQENPTFLKFNFGKNPEGVDDKHFLMFTDVEAYQKCRDKMGIEALGEYYITTSGTSVFGNIDEDVLILNVNPESPGELHYKRDQLPRLQSWVGILEVERILSEILTTSKGYAKLREFKQYAVVSNPASETLSVACAPDSKGRRLAALFTADDAVDAYFAKEGGDDRPVYSVEGEAIFDFLRTQELNGIVFNCSGPITPRAFALPFLDLIMTGER